MKNPLPLRCKIQPFKSREREDGEMITRMDWMLDKENFVHTDGLHDRDKGDYSGTWNPAASPKSNEYR